MLSRINHIVVLMLENRSFDCLLGALYPKSAGFDGLTGTESNLDADHNPVHVWNSHGTDEATMSIPSPDPGELWTDMNEQLFGSSTVPPPPVPTMSGFVANYLRQTAEPPYAGRSVMHYFLPEQVPVISGLARQFAVCDRWHASAPNQTWPNRFFTHTGTANGYVNNDPPHFPYEMPTIFNRLEDSQKPWKIYFHDIPQTLSLTKLWQHADHFSLYGEFQQDARQGKLPAYSFIEPRYFADLSPPNDMHPPHVVTLGEQLIADVYNALRQGPSWTETLLIVTFDEHGGCYDHVLPPAAVPPGDTATTPFNFDRYGVRVPAVIVSPFVPQGTVLRPTGATPFDHTSIIKTVRTRFSLGPPLSDREASAPDLAAALSLSEPSNLGPAAVTALPYAPSPAALAVAHARPLNHMQQALLDLAARLPAAATEGDFAPFIAAHLMSIRGADLPPLGKDMIDAVAFIRRRLGNLFGSL
jgi:phospholipase C